MIRVLCSGMALGHYIPGLQIRNELRRLGRRVQTEVHETLLPSQQKQSIDGAAQEYRDHFDLALLGQRLALSGLLAPRSIDSACDSLLTRWQHDEVSFLILISGHWLPLATAYQQREPRCIVQLVHIDSVNSPSWATSSAVPASFEHIWLCSAKDRRLHARIPLPDLLPLDWTSRCHRVVCHGGGWGLGTYRDSLVSLLQHGFHVDVVVHSEEDGKKLPSGCKWCLLDPIWRPWSDTNGEHSFPPLIDPSTETLRPSGSYQALLDRVRGARAIISKPGGATLTDSLATATPVVFLEPYGEHEKANARLWQELGLGLNFKTWQNKVYEDENLEHCHKLLLEEARTVDLYPQEYLP